MAMTVEEKKNNKGWERSAVEKQRETDRTIDLFVDFMFLLTGITLLYSSYISAWLIPSQDLKFLFIGYLAMNIGFFLMKRI